MRFDSLTSPLFILGSIAFSVFHPTSSLAGPYGSLVGQVIDESGQPAANVEIHIKSPALLGGTQTFVTGDDGSFKFVDLQPGLYEAHFSGKDYREMYAKDVLVRKDRASKVNPSLLPVGRTYVNGPNAENALPPLADCLTTERVPEVLGALEEAIASSKPGKAPGLPDVWVSDLDDGRRVGRFGQAIESLGRYAVWTIGEVSPSTVIPGGSIRIIGMGAVTDDQTRTPLFSLQDSAGAATGVVFDPRGGEVLARVLYQVPSTDGQYLFRRIYLDHNYLVLGEIERTTGWPSSGHPDAKREAEMRACPAGKYRLKPQGWVTADP